MRGEMATQTLDQALEQLFQSARVAVRMLENLTDHHGVAQRARQLLTHEIEQVEQAKNQPPPKIELVKFPEPSPDDKLGKELSNTQVLAVAQARQNKRLLNLLERWIADLCHVAPEVTFTAKEVRESVNMIYYSRDPA